VIGIDRPRTDAVTGTAMVIGTGANIAIVFCRVTLPRLHNNAVGTGRHRTDIVASITGTIVLAICAVMRPPTRVPPSGLAQTDATPEATETDGHRSDIAVPTSLSL
jgi:hypothetical protein